MSVEAGVALLPWRLAHGEDLVGGDAMEDLLDSAGPLHLKLINPGRRAQTEMHAFITGRPVADASRRVIVLNAFGGNNFDPRSESVTIAYRSD